MVKITISCQYASSRFAGICYYMGIPVVFTCRSLVVPHNSLSQIVPVLRVSIGPVILLSGVSLLLPTMTGVPAPGFFPWIFRLLANEPVISGVVAFEIVRRCIAAQVTVNALTDYIIPAGRVFRVTHSINSWPFSLSFCKLNFAAAEH